MIVLFLCFRTLNEFRYTLASKLVCSYWVNSIFKNGVAHEFQVLFLMLLLGCQGFWKYKNVEGGVGKRVPAFSSKIFLEYWLTGFLFRLVYLQKSVEEWWNRTMWVVNLGHCAVIVGDGCSKHGFSSAGTWSTLSSSDYQLSAV